MKRSIPQTPSVIHFRHMQAVKLVETYTRIMSEILEANHRERDRGWVSVALPQWEVLEELACQTARTLDDLGSSAVSLLRSGSPRLLDLRGDTPIGPDDLTAVESMAIANFATPDHLGRLLELGLPANDFLGEMIVRAEAEPEMAHLLEAWIDRCGLSAAAAGLPFLDFEGLLGKAPRVAPAATRRIARTRPEILQRFTTDCAENGWFRELELLVACGAPLPHQDAEWWRSTRQPDPADIFRSAHGRIQIDLRNQDLRARSLAPIVTPDRAA